MKVEFGAHVGQWVIGVGLTYTVFFDRRSFTIHILCFSVAFSWRSK